MQESRVRGLQGGRGRLDITTALDVLVIHEVHIHLVMLFRHIDTIDTLVMTYTILALLVVGGIASDTPRCAAGSCCARQLVSESGCGHRASGYGGGNRWVTGIV